MDFTAIIDRIYEAGTYPELWPDVLDSLSEIAGAEGGAILSFSAQHSKYLVSRRLEPVMAQFFADGWVERNSRSRLVARTEPRFLTDHDGFTDAEMKNDPLYRDFLVPNGLGWCTGTTIRVPGFQDVVVTLERAYDKGPVRTEQTDLLDQLRPHIARAALFSARLGLETVRSSVQVMASLGLPAAVLDKSGRILGLNTLFEPVWAPKGTEIGERVRFQDARVQSMLDRALESTAAHTKALNAARSFPAVAPLTGARHILHVMPVTGIGHDLFSGASWILFSTPVEKRMAPQADMLQSLFDLTPSEAKVASQLASGLTIKSISTTNSVSPETVRTHLKSVFSKTGTHRQAELISLLSVPRYETPIG